MSLSYNYFQNKLKSIMLYRQKRRTNIIEGRMPTSLKKKENSAEILRKTIKSQNFKSFSREQINYIKPTSFIKEQKNNNLLKNRSISPFNSEFKNSIYSKIKKRNFSKEQNLLKEGYLSSEKNKTKQSSQIKNKKIKNESISKKKYFSYKPVINMNLKKIIYNPKNVVSKNSSIINNVNSNGKKIKSMKICSKRNSKKNLFSKDQNKNMVSNEFENEKKINKDKKKNVKIFKMENMKIVCCYKTKKGYNMYDLTKKNQDSYFSKHINFSGNKNSVKNNDCVFFGVCDGHGKNGDKISQFICKTLPKKLDQHFSKKGKKDNKRNEKISSDVLEKIENEKKEKVENILFKSLKNTVEELFKSELDTYFSGSTLNCVLIKNFNIYACNVGDSRSIIAGGEDFETIHLLSIDHKPENDLERERVLKKKGRIHKMKDNKGCEYGPLRIWLPDENLPGLAMSRSIGDLIGSSIGITWRPHMQIKGLCEKQNSIIVIASDGVWDVLTNEEVISIVKPFWNNKDILSATDFLVKECVKKWKENVEGVVDDISVIVIFIEH
jgi:serine/threonine protein phosphatase PrpC